MWLSVKKRPGSQWVGIGRLNHLLDKVILPDYHHSIIQIYLIYNDTRERESSAVQTLDFF